MTNILTLEYTLKEMYRSKTQIFVHIVLVSMFYNVPDGRGHL